MLFGGDNLFKSVSYTIEVGCTEAFVEEKESLRTVEAQILSKRLELSKFESDYKQVLAQFTEMTGRYAQEMQAVHRTGTKARKWSGTGAFLELQLKCKWHFWNYNFARHWNYNSHSLLVNVF
ncbi:hypothetical protein L2E82_50951 [Cichorium intybus]|nr:hypothetical protein L2E82_50951 [Cichorium intybus]